MFQIREHYSDAVTQRQRRQMVGIAATGHNVPVPSEEWLNRWCTLPKDFETFFKEIHDFEVKSDDVFVVTFPKSGTTWMQEAAWLLLNNLDYERAFSENLAYRSVFMDLTAIYNNITENTIQLAAESKSPRLIKSHLPAHLLPKQIWQKKVKLIYCARNPKDVVVSYYPFHRNLGTWHGSSINEFIDDFINEDILYTPYWPSVMDFWQMRHEPQIFFVTYEEMQRDLKSVLVRLNKFFDRPVLKEEEIEKLMDHLSFGKMKENNRTNPTEGIKKGPRRLNVSSEFQFMRRGKAGSFKDELTVEQQQKLDKWTNSFLEKYRISEEDIFGSV